ncbi:MAG: uroporphyrinogen-III synthase, partial [Methanoregulaceae archaeon]|nr:uroporphyrinogen-III synthase [Methanoregulaceae archaeon]
MRIAITRIAGKEESDGARCRAFGHECYSVTPLTASLRDDQIQAFLSAVRKGDFDCIFFTSALPARAIAPLLSGYPRIIAIGPQTAQALRSHGIVCEVLPGFYSRDFVPYLGEWIRGKRIGIPRADVPNRNLIEAIEKAGARAIEYRCYSLEPIGKELDLSGADAVLFTSAMSFSRAIWQPRRDLLVMAIGDVTAGVMREHGVTPDVVGDGSLEGVLQVLGTYLADRDGRFG